MQSDPNAAVRRREAQRIGIPRETFPLEKRVATVPDMVEKLIKLGFKVSIESGAGEAANFSVDAYRAAGAEALSDAAVLWAASDIVFKVRPPSTDEVVLMREGTILIDFMWPAQNPELMQQLASGYAGVDNLLFYRNNNRVLFGDAKKMLGEALAVLRE